MKLHIDSDKKLFSLLEKETEPSCVKLSVNLKKFYHLFKSLQEVLQKWYANANLIFEGKNLSILNKPHVSLVTELLEQAQGNFIYFLFEYFNFIIVLEFPFRPLPLTSLLEIYDKTILLSSEIESLLGKKGGDIVCNNDYFVQLPELIEKVSNLVWY